MTTTQKAVLLHPMGSMGESTEIEVAGSDWTGIPGDTAGDEYRRKVRLTVHGSEAWDHAAGESA